MWATVWMVRTKPGASGREALNGWALSPAPVFLSLRQRLILAQARLELISTQTGLKLLTIFLGLPTECSDPGVS